ncbi:hypothetical protein GH714_032338 [Hevea brasiliensis]|uniref:NAD-dependent epimerase/dehydratase domain-containing protein n=1 Tax=Hevea brasiliensis TaxID=3981 RepID=A0A6A6L563_HEVBR|nr:hypothetical protein GH714_032338 [Hevea brasiliensis]
MWVGNEKKLAHLRKLEGAKERLQLVKANLMEMGSFDDAIFGCQGVFHTASPVLGPSSDPKACVLQHCMRTKHCNMVLLYLKINRCLMVFILLVLQAEILEPAVEGTLNVLRSCEKNPFLKRVVLTSSSSTVRARDDFDPSYLWTSHLGALWNSARDSSLPPELCSTASDVLGLLKGETGKFQWHGRMGYVHIDDVALCHILVYEQESAHGRYLCNSTVLEVHELVSFLSARYPSLPIPERFEQLNMPYYDFNTSKLKSLGFKFKPIQKMFDDCVASLMEQGHLTVAVD